VLHPFVVAIIMSSNSENSPDAIMVSDSGATEPSNGINTSPDAQGEGHSGAPKPKRLACMICRKRKLKCDGNKPSCSTCTRLRHTCAYDEVRRKSGPKRGYVKALEERLSTLLLVWSIRDTTETLLTAMQNKSRHCFRGKKRRHRRPMQKKPRPKHPSPPL